MSKSNKGETIQNAIAILHKCFCKYAGTDGDKNTMSKKEVAAMFKAEFPELEAALNDPSAKGQKEVLDLFSLLDEDGDGVVNFQEYICFVATLSLIVSGC